MLAGSNAGAELSLAPGEWLIGSGTEADLTFAEPALAAEHVRLTVEPSGIRVIALAEGLAMSGDVVPVGVESGVPLLVPMRIGATLFTLGAVGSNWAAVAAQTVVASTSAQEPRKASEPSPDELEGDATPSDSAAIEPGLEIPKDEPAPPRTAPIRPKWAAQLLSRNGLIGMGGLALTLMVGLVSWYTWLLSARSVPTPHGEPLQDLQRAISSLGMRGSVNVVVRGPDRFAVTGRLHTDAELQKLNTEIQRTGLSVETTVVTDTSITDTAATILHAFDIDGSVTVTDTGDLTVHGFAPSSVAVASAMAQLRSEVPGVHGVEDKLDTPERARAELEDKLQSAGLSSALGISGNQRRLTVTGLLPPEQARVWKEIYERFRSKYSNNIALDEEVAAPARVTPRGIVLGGRMPSIVLDSGQRVRVGDTLKNVGRVISIDARHVRVQTSAGPVDVSFVHPPNWILEDNDDDDKTRRD
nr:type III secretion system inner membrane ring subunit SctD [Hyphomicrobium sp. MC1]